MAKTKQQIYDEELALLNEYVSNNDYKGMYLHMEEKYREVEAGETEASDPLNAAWKAFLKDLSISKDPYHHQFARDFVKFGGKRMGELLIDTGLQTDEIEEQIKNGEFEGTELINSEPKLVRKAALSINTFKTKLGIAQNTVWSLNQYILMPLRRTHISNNDELEKEYSNLREEGAHNEFDNDPRVNDEKRKRYREELSVQPGADIYVSSSQDKQFENICYKVSGEEGGPLYSHVSELETHLKKMNDEELERYKQELISNRDVMNAYNTAGKEWAEKAAELAKELDEKTSPEEKKTEGYRQLKEALDLNAGFGSRRTYTVPGSQDKKTTPGFTQETFADYSSMLKTAAEAFPDKDLCTKILNASETAGQKLERCYAAGVENIRDQSRSFANANPKGIETDIRRVEEEQNLRLLQADPRGKKLKTTQDAIRECSSLQSDIVLFKDAVRKSLHACDFRNTDLQDDAAGRKIPENERNKHAEYFKLLESFGGLKDMDLEIMTPRQILDRLKEVKQDADTYEKTHAGLRNLTKAWSTEGRDRVKLIRSVSELLDKQIKALEPSVKALEEKVGAETLQSKFAQLQNKKTALRKQAAAVKVNILTPPDKKIENRIQGYRNSASGHAAQRLEDAQNKNKPAMQKTGTILESAANVAADSLARLHELSNSKQPLSEEEKQEALTGIARTVCYDNPMFSPSKNMNEEQYKEFIKPFETGKHFRDSVKETIGEISQENLKKFCADPSLSKEIAGKAAKKHINNTIYDYSKKKREPAAEKNLNGPAPEPQV